MIDPIAIPEQLLAQIYAHARRVFPAECCGYLVGREPGIVDGIVECTNDQDGGDHPTAPGLGAEIAFVIAGRELFTFARSFDTDRPARILYHSHTHGRAYFSAIDRSVLDGPAYPVQQLVVGLTATAVVEAAQFAWSDHERAHVEIARWRIA
jgi:[CysO sulfur-carrier protein]-S-L-cysteine hydrolase